MEKNFQVSIQAVWRKYRKNLSQVEALIHKNMETRSPLIKGAARYILHSGGKRLRPLLLLLSSRLCRHEGNGAVLLAGAIECIHTATLLHDDVIDDAEMRRGEKAVRTVWGNHASILVGDYFYTRAVSMAGALKNQEVNTALAEACKQILEGEALQWGWNGDVNISEKRYLRFIEYKTATLMATACRLGGIIAGVHTTQKERLEQFGRNLGIAFQVADDVLDYTGSKKVFGKRQGKDLREGQITLPLLHLLRQCRGRERDKIITLVKNDGFREKDLRFTVELMEHYGSIGYSLQKARDFVTKAKESLLPFPASSARQALFAVADYVVNRDH